MTVLEHGMLFRGFYREHLFNDHWGEQAHVNPDNSLTINMVSQGLDTGAGYKSLAAVSRLGGAFGARIFG